jgi:RNA exonuclease 4
LALDMLRQVLPPTAVLVGMNIRKDIEWLGLVEGDDYAACIDLADLFRVWHADKRSYTYFSLDHVVISH